MVILYSIRESAKAAERAQAMEQRRQLQPRQFSLENTILPSPSADFAMAEGLAPTPTIIDAEGSNNSWGRAGSSEEEAFEARESPANPHAAAPGPGTESYHTVFPHGENNMGTAFLDAQSAAEEII